jgi:type IV pilus assembly protein PilW
VVTTVFFVGASGGEPALYRLTLASNGRWDNAAVLVAGVENMQVLYGIDTDGDGILNRYVTADQVPSWQNVTAVRIGLLLRSTGGTGDSGDTGDNLRPDPDSTTYPINGAPDGSGYTPLTTQVSLAAGVWDHRLRRAISTTVTLRNRFQSGSTL